MKGVSKRTKDHGYGVVLQWSLNDELHRVSVPALVYSWGSTFWFYRGRSHRLNGPACISTNFSQYWIQGYGAADAEQFRNKHWRRLCLLRYMARER
jgi:hypothetical protein